MLVIHGLDRCGVNSVHNLSLGFFRVVANHQLSTYPCKELDVQEGTIYRLILVHSAFHALP